VMMPLVVLMRRRRHEPPSLPVPSARKRDVPLQSRIEQEEEVLIPG